MLTYKDHLKDERVECYSVLMTISIADYLNFIGDVYKQKGGIDGQRSPLKTKSAQRIRKRLIDDLNRGTVIPPIVVGVKLDSALFEEFGSNIEKNSETIFKKLNTQEQVSIIDGMQRTTALFEALSIPNFDKNRKIRLELWIAKSTNSLIYRMLVLNSGQIPWNIKRQLEVVFSQLKKELESNINGLELYTSDEPNTRSNAGQYQASQFIELFMLFGTKRVSIDIQEELAEEFARLDIIETSGNKNFMDTFYGISKILVDLDNTFSLLNTIPTDFELSKYKTGKHIFSSQPARAGFMVAASQEIFGLPGIELPESDQKAKFETLQQSVSLFINEIRNKNQLELFEIIDLATLDEQTNLKTSKVGEFERNYFLKSFKTFFELVKLGTLSNLTPCWRSSH